MRAPRSGGRTSPSVAGPEAKANVPHASPPSPEGVAAPKREPFSRQLSPDGLLRRAHLLGHNLAAPPRPSPAVAGRPGASGAPSIHSIQRLTCGWKVGGNTEWRELQALGNAARARVAACRALFDQLDAGWVHAVGRKGNARRSVVAIEQSLADEDAESVAWKDVAKRRASLTALGTESERVFDNLSRQSVRQSAGATQAQFDDVRARAGAVFDGYARALTGTLFRDSIAHFGTANHFADVLAAASLAGATPAFVTRYLTAALAQPWGLNPTLHYLGRMAGSSAAELESSLTWALEFTAAGNTGWGAAGARPDAPGEGGAHAAIAAAQTYPINFNDKWYSRGPRRDTNLIIAPGDLAHWRCGHTFEDYRLTRGNANRAPASSLWPRGTGSPAILADATAAVAALDEPIRTEIATLPLRFELDTAVGAFSYHVGINNVSGAANNLYRMVQFFPTGGGESVTRGALNAIISLFGGGA